MYAPFTLGGVNFMIYIEEATYRDADILTNIKIEALNNEIKTYSSSLERPIEKDDLQSELYIIKNYKDYKIILDNEIIGCFFIEILSSTSIQINDFAILPEFQHRGYGTAVLSMIEDTYNHIKEFHIFTPIFSIGNQQLYKKCGYKKISINDDEILYIKYNTSFFTKSDIT